MSEVLFENTKLAAYFLWEHTKHDNALALWYCAEDIAYFMERKGYLTLSDINDIRSREYADYIYVNFVRNIAYRIYVYTHICEAGTNWFMTESLLANSEWCMAIAMVAKVFNDNKDNFRLLAGVRSEHIRKFYTSTLHN